MDVLKKLLPLGKTEIWMYHKENKPGKRAEWREGTLETPHTLNSLWGKGITNGDLSCTSLSLILIALQIKEAAKKKTKVPIISGNG